MHKNPDNEFMGVLFEFVFNVNNESNADKSGLCCCCCCMIGCWINCCCMIGCCCGLQELDCDGCILKFEKVWLFFIWLTFFSINVAVKSFVWEKVFEVDAEARFWGFNWGCEANFEATSLSFSNFCLSDNDKFRELGLLTYEPRPKPLNTWSSSEVVLLLLGIIWPGFNWLESICRAVLENKI